MNCREMSLVWGWSEVACHCLRLYYSLIHLFQALIWGLKSAAAKKRILFTPIHRDNAMAKAQAPWEAAAVCHIHHTHTCTVPCYARSLCEPDSGDHPVKALGRGQIMGLCADAYMLVSSINMDTNVLCVCISLALCELTWNCVCVTEKEVSWSGMAILGS